ncbi:substrate-binding domain-containing protein [Halomarina litorea]|uniref:substrate-binding domain-containing protein n=1 Tax=Halomarina litorea TaxID=2961595 RepID=UPI0020C1C9A8|nr:substrate-binding domain-containing protein [Halomarina sp. BCD28]
MRRRSVLGLAGGAAATLTGGALASTLGGESTPDAPEARALVAGSLLRVARSVPDGTVEAHGSAAVNRLVREGARRPDAVALADPVLFEGVCDQATLFATNALVLAYDPDGPHADAIRTDWRAVADPGVRVGRTDPENDPLGYRTVMAMDLAGLGGALDGSVVLREVDLASVLAGGRLDAAFVYRSMAVQHDLPSVPLPADIDFSDPDRAEAYADASYDLPERTVRGAPIRYGVGVRTDRGTSWARRLATGTDRLREAGFTVPDGYPRDVPVG